MGSSNTRIGTTVAGYRLESLLGRGGMSVVYVAEHVHLGRKVALKLLAHALAEDESFRERFERESRRASELDHPNIVPIFDAGEEDGQLYIAMRFVQGCDLKALIKRDGPLGLGRTLFILEQAASALDAAHDRDLVHRDVKPANILIEEPSERVFVSDFGVVKHTASHGLTRTGFFIGTVDYAAPEQIEGLPVDARTDVYSLGCVLYECLTGKAPFEREGEVAVMHAHLTEPPPTLKGLRPDLPKELSRVIQTAMAKAKEDRYGSCMELITAARSAALRRPTVTSEPALEEAGVAGVAVEEAMEEAADAAGASTAGDTHPPAEIIAGAAGPISAEPKRTPAGTARPWLVAGGAALVAALAAGVIVYFVARDGTTGGAPPDVSAPGTVDRLESLVPLDVWVDCQLQEPATRGSDESAIRLPTASSAVRRHPDAWEAAIYSDEATMNSAYEAEFAAAVSREPSLARDAGSCSRTAWRGESAWRHPDGNVGGRRFCFVDRRTDEYVVVWMHMRNGPAGPQPNHRDLLGVARLAGAARHDILFSWWDFWHHRIGRARE